MQIDITGVDKAELLAALFNASKQQGLGSLNPQGKQAMTKEHAAEILAGGANFDYLHGRVMKVHLGGDSFSSSLYDRDNGEGAAARAIQHLLPVVDAR